MNQKEPSQTLKVDKVLQLASEGGHLSKTLKGFESRSQQQMMMKNIIDAYNHHQISLIEAGTGTGKSIAYLIPAILWAAKTSERTVISTHTITLQEQLVKKDIPILLETLNIKLKVALVKGMNNYICIRKLDDALLEMRLFPSEEAHEIERIDKLKFSLAEGSKSELPFLPSINAWDKVGAESDACSHNECPYYQQCFFFKARRQANEAQILVANHALLLADLAKREETNNYNDAAILPPYKKIVLDEAHHIEEMASEYFADKLHRMELLRTLGRLSVEKNQKNQGKLFLLKEKLQLLYNKAPPKDVASIVSKLSIDLPALRHTLNDQIHDTFESFVQFIDSLKERNESSEDLELLQEQKLRLLQIHQSHPKWSQDIVPQANKLIHSLKEYRQQIEGIEIDIKNISNERLQEQTKSMRLDIQALSLRIGMATQFLEEFLKILKDPNKVRWMETKKYKTSTNIQLVDADLDVSKSLVNCLFSKFPTIVLCSATLTSNKRFDFIRNRLGLTKTLMPSHSISEHIYESPFNYQKQALLAVPTDLPSPLDPEFNLAAFEYIWKAVLASKGNAFVLFTSYTMLQNCYNFLSKRFAQNRFTVFKQGDGNRTDLLNNFKKTNYSVLMGTDSFWEGVDVAGDALRCVIIVKLPFKVPSEPLIQARTEAINARGGNSFFDYSVPNAIVKFKQGFGRLIRNKWDRGCIICLDKRLITKNYGQMFINSLPSCEKYFSTGENVLRKMEDFYHNTFYLVKNNPANNR